jgi:hypothetical protein
MKTCARCNKSIRNAAKACDQCGNDSFLAPAGASGQGDPPGCIVGCLAIFALFIVLGGIGTCWKACAGTNVSVPVPPTPPSKPESPTPPQSPKLKVVANTHGEGVFLRKSVAQPDRSRAVPEGTTLEVTGATDTQAGTDWAEVRVPDGTAWVPSRFLADPTPTPSTSSGGEN